MRAEDVQKALSARSRPDFAVALRRFFQTGPGGYGEGDRFRGLKVPVIRKTALAFAALPFPEAKRLLASPWHEDRFAALVILARQFRRGDDALQGRIYRLYLRGAKWINNWDLVDVFAPRILGVYLEHRDRSPLFALARSRNLWERRMAMLSTAWFIRQGDFADALRIADMLSASPEDLMHKAVGWMLREVGNRDRKAEEAWLAPRYRTLPRTLLRYAIEKFPPDRRRAYLMGTL